MTATQITIGLTIISMTAAALIFVLNKLVSKTKHEKGQDDKIQMLINQREQSIINQDLVCKELVSRIADLERNDKTKEITLITIKKDLESLTIQHETTQTMIQRLEDHQQETFSELIKTIREMAR